MREVMRAVATLVTLLAAGAVNAAEPVRLHAAGSLRQALGDVAVAFEAESGVRVNPVWGASGLLRERLAEGEPGAVFASANMEHRQALARAGKAGPAGPRGEKITTRNDGSRNPQE